MTRQRHSPDPTVTWPGDYLIPSMETKFNRKKNERGSSQRKEIGIIACKKCTLKTTKLHWSHFERDQWENIIMGNQIVPGIYATTVPISCYFLFEFPCNPLPRNVILSFLWWNRRENVLPFVTGNWWDAYLVSGELCLHSQIRWRLNDGHVVQNPQRKWFFKIIF